MRAEHAAIFAHFPDWDIAVVGSSLRNFVTARDIDVLFRASQDFRQLAREVGVRYAGGWNMGEARIHRLNYTVPGLDKPVQLIQRSTVEDFDQWPHAVLLRDGTLLHEGQFYDKPGPASRARQDLPTAD